MWTYYFSKWGMQIAGITESDQRYIDRRRKEEVCNLMTELECDLNRNNCSMTYGTVDENGKVRVVVTENSRPNIHFIFNIHAECGELIEIVGYKAAFQAESAATRQSAYFYVPSKGPANTGMANFMADTARQWGKSPAAPKP